MTEVPTYFIICFIICFIVALVFAFLYFRFVPKKTRSVIEQIMNEGIGTPDFGFGNGYGGKKKVVGYKVMRRTARGFVSPVRGSLWYGGELQANDDPRYGNQNGIYMTYSADDPEIKNYLDKYPDGVVVEVEANRYHNIVLHERGMRASRAKIRRVVK